MITLSPLATALYLQLVLLLLLFSGWLFFRYRRLKKKAAGDGYHPR